MVCFRLQEVCGFNLKSCILNIGASAKPHILFFIEKEKYAKEFKKKRSASPRAEAAPRFFGPKHTK
jgi:hypothetical protein